MVADRLHSLRKELGLAGILAEMNCGGLIPQERMMRSLQLMCEKCSHGFIEICRVYRSQRGGRPRPPLHLSQVIQVRPALRKKVIPSKVRSGGILLPNLIQNALFCSLPMGNRSGQVDAASSVYKNLSDAIRPLLLSNGGAGTASQQCVLLFPALHRAC
jgi:hypothetical protein